MAIIKPFIAARRFSSTIGAGTGTGATFNILATAFTDDTGAAATAFPTSPAYYNLYINGIVQEGNTSTVTTTAITIPDGDTLDPATPVTVEFVIT
jgi:ribose 5-phosphate isomerase